MNLTAPPAILAPQTTGHPNGLPDAAPPDKELGKVAGVSDDVDTQGANLRDSREDKEGKSRDRENKDEAASAPPTVLQLKINEILKEQAEALERNQPDPKPDNKEDVAASDSVQSNFEATYTPPKETIETETEPYEPQTGEMLPAAEDAKENEIREQYEEKSIIEDPQQMPV